ncbi:tape measure protein, partial [Acinetobacter sichuanensis]
MASKLGTLTLDLVCRVGNFTQAMREASSSASREMGRIESSTSSAQSMLKSLAATAAATFTVSQIVNYADSYTGMINKLKLVTENQSQLSIAMSDTHRIAQSTASEWGGVVDVYTKFQKISDRLGLSQKEVARVTETVTKAVGMSGASAEEAQRALIQFSQGLSLGVLRGQDLNSVMQQTPALTDAIAKGMGVTSDKLKQMGADNILTTESIVKALEKVAASVDADFAKTATLVSASFDLIKNEAIKMVGEFDAATGASSTFVKGMTELSENMDVAVGGLTVATAYMIGSYIPAITLGTKTLVVDTIAKVSSIAATRAKVLADYEVAKSNLAATAAMARSMGATNAQTAAMMANARAAYQQAAANKAAALSSATAFLGPVGLGLTVAAVAASYLLLKDSTDESTKSLRENNESVDEAIAKYRDLEEAKQKSQLVTEKEQLNELKEARDNATDSLITNAYALTRHNDVTAIQSKELNALIAEFKKNGDINQFSKSINALTFINQKSKDQFNKLAGTVSDTNGKYKAQKSLIDEINKLTPNAVKATDDRAAAAERERKAIEAANKAYADYSKSAFADIKEIAARKFFQEKGLSKNQTDERMAVLKAFDYNNQALKTEIGKEAIKLADINAKMKDAEEVRAEALKKQTEELKEQGKALKLNAQIQENAAKYNFAALESKYNLPKGTLSAIHAIETGNTGKTNQVNKTTGASGGFQFMPDTAKRFKISGQTFDLGKSAEAAAKYMNYLLEFFKGDLEKAVRAYHAGEGNVQRGTNIGKYNNDYWKKYQGYMAGASGQTFGTDYTVENYLSDFEKGDEAFRKFQNDQNEFRKQLSSEDVIRNQKRIDDIAEAERLGLQHLIPRIEERYANETRLSKLELDQQLNSWSWTEDEKLKKEAEINKAHIALSSELNDIQKQLAKESVDEQLAYDLQQFRKAQKWEEFEAINDFKAIQDQIRGLSSNTDDIFAKATMTPSEYQSWSLKNNRDSAKLGLRSDLTSVEQNIMQSDAFKTGDDRYQKLIDAHKEYRDALAAIDVQYDQQVKDLAQSQYDSQMGIWQDLLSRTGTIFN